MDLLVARLLFIMVTSRTNLEATTSKALPLRLVLKVIMRSSIPMPYSICLGIIQLGFAL